VSLSTLYRWGQKWRASPRPDVAVDKVIKEADRQAKRERKVREKKVKEQAAEVVSKASALIPALPTVDSVAAAGGMVS